MDLRRYLTPDLWKPTHFVKTPFQEWSRNRDRKGPSTWCETRSASPFTHVKMLLDQVSGLALLGGPLESGPRFAAKCCALELDRSAPRSLRNSSVSQMHAPGARSDYLQQTKPKVVEA